MTPVVHRFAASLVEGGLAALLALALPAQATAGAARALTWEDLRPASLEEVADPFAQMPDEQVEMLRALVRSRILEARGFPVTDDARRTREQLTGKLAAQGVDVDAMLARRDAIIAARRRAAEGGITALEGQEVRLSGFLLAVAVIDGYVTEYVLVAAPGACSHAMPPSPNQVVRVRPSQPSTLAGYYEPATAIGTLRLRLESRSVHLVDGERVLASTYAIDDADVVPRDR